MGENFDLPDFCDALRQNHTVRHVCFSGTFVRELAPDQWRTMLESIGYLPTLEELQIWCSTIPADVFAHTLHHATRLAKVYFFRVGLDGNQDDMNALADALAVHPALRDVRIGGFHLIQQQNEEGGGAGATAEGADPHAAPQQTVNIDRLVAALGQTPKLEVVSLQLSGSQRNIPCGAAALHSLLQSSSITDLYLSRLGLAESHLEVIAAALAVNTTLRSLDLFGNNIENEHIIDMAQSLSRNTRLEALVLPCPTCDLSVAACEAISQALQINTTLITFNLPRSNLSDEGIIHLAEGLTVNKTLKKIEVGVSKTVGDQGLQALTTMLEQNYQLERVVVSSADQSIKQKAEYYMRLNEVGRGKLLRSNGNATREAWVDILAACTNDLDCLYYFVKTNPAICQFAQATFHQAPFICTHELRISRRHTIHHWAAGGDRNSSGGGCAGTTAAQSNAAGASSPNVSGQSRRASGFF